MVVDGQLLVEEEYKRDDNDKTNSPTLVLGSKNPVKITNVNVFKSALSVQRMIGMTIAVATVIGGGGGVQKLVLISYILYLKIFLFLPAHNMLKSSLQSGKYKYLQLIQLVFPYCPKQQKTDQ